MAPFEQVGSWSDWTRQGLIFTEAVRGGPMVWRVGEDHLVGDVLGPIRHAHDGAAEYYYIIRGACLCEVGGQERVANAGDLVYIPADAPHNLLRQEGDEDCWVLVLVAPNFAHNKWRTSDYIDGAEDKRMTVTRPLDGDTGAETAALFTAFALDVERDRPVSHVSNTAELIYIVAEGECHVRMGRMAGNFGESGLIYVRRDVDHELTSLTETTRLVRFECPFVPFAGVPLGPDGAHENY